MNKINLNNVTLVTVTSIDLHDTVDALLYNLKGVEFSSVKFISHQRPDNLPRSVEYCQCDKISTLEEYSKFMIYDLKDHVDTAFCLTIQRDGVIVNPKRWKQEFLKYDYIGAPWPIDDAFRDPAGNLIRVGNGGFSLRSKKLLELASREKIPATAHSGCFNEDAFMCVQYRHLYEKNGIRFAPVDVAKYFAHEIMVPEIKGIKPFGFHKYRKQNRFYPKFPSDVKKYIRKILYRFEMY